MKNFLLIVAIAFISITAQAKEKPNMTEVTYKCSIDCHDCKEKILKNISYEKGIKAIEVDIPTQLVKIKYRNDKTDSESIKKSLEKLGYETEVVPAKKG